MYVCSSVCNYVWNYVFMYVHVCMYVCMNKGVEYLSCQLYRARLQILLQKDKTGRASGLF